MSDTLTLRLKGEYFKAIKCGEKEFEYRLTTPYWTRRLKNRIYEEIAIILGYLSREKTDLRIVRPYRGYTIQIITHPHFFPDPVEVFAIDVRP